jgi:tetratricopeptide (TPR) repeat protein
MTDAGSGETRNTISGGIFLSAVIQGRDVTVTLPPEITPALWGLPSGTSAFIGRDIELRTLLDVLAPRTGAANGGAASGPSRGPTAVVAAVGGLAGIGKTELAIQAACAALDRGWFPGGVLFVDLFGYDPARSLGPGQALEGFLRALAIPGEHIPPATQDRARLYASVLAAYAREGRRILVVIDNAATHEQAKSLLPTDPSSAAIVTSRDTLGMLGARLLDLDILTTENAADMLDAALRVARPGDTRATDHPGDAARIADLCSGLPLALRIIAALLSETLRRPLAEMAADLEDERTRLDELSYGHNAVRAAFDLSYRRLDQGLARLFRLLTINPGPDISADAAAALANIDKRAARRGLEALARGHLIDPDDSYGRWRMHDLLRLYAQQLSDARAQSNEREQACDRLLHYYLKVAHEADAHLRALPGTPVPAGFTGRDSALAWLDAERPSLVAAVTMAISTGRDEIAMLLPLSLGEYLAWRRRLDDLLSITTISRDAARRLHNRGIEAVALADLGKALWELRRFEEAITTHQDAAAIFRETGDRHGEGMALDNLGVALVAAGRFDEAITAHRETAAMFRETGDRQGEAGALTNLGGALRQAGRVQEAITAHQDAAAIFRETGDRRGEGIALDNLVSALVEAGPFEEAITAGQDAAAIFRETGDRHGEGIALGNLGLALVQAGRVQEAITAFQEALAIRRETGDRHGEGMALGSLGLALAEAGRLQEAITAHRDAAAIFRETGDRQDQAATLTNIGIAQDSLGVASVEAGRLQEAITAHRDAAAIFRETGDRHGEGMALGNLGLALAEAGRFDEAIIVYRDAAAIFRETGNRQDQAATLTNIGIALAEAGRLGEGITAFQEALAICRETGDRHGEGRAQGNLGLALAEAGRLQEAITAYRDAAAIFRETGDRHGEGIALDNLGVALREAGRLEEAITAHQDAAAIFRETGDGDGEGMALTNLEVDRAAQHV